MSEMFSEAELHVWKFGKKVVPNLVAWLLICFGDGNLDSHKFVKVAILCMFSSNCRLFFKVNAVERFEFCSYSL